MNLICRVQFDAETVETGGMLSGRVFLLEDTPSVAKAHKLLLCAVCRAEGPGEPEARVLNSTERPGPFRPQAAIPFRLAVPKRGPATYQGIMLQIRWHLDVQLVVPGGFSPRREVPFQVIPARPATSNHLP